MKKARRRSVSALRFCKRTRDGPPRAVSTDVNGDEQVLRPPVVEDLGIARLALGSTGRLSRQLARLIRARSP